MIPYDDLVAALQAWRARQGLPVSTQAPVANTSNGQPSRSTPAGGYAAQQRPGTPPPAPPPAPKRATTAPRMPLPLAAVDTADEHLDALEVEEHEAVESSLIEESHYENEGDDFAMSFGNNGNGHHHNAGQSSDETLVGDDVAMSFGGGGGGSGNGHGHHHQSSDETLVGDDVPEATDPARSHNTREDW